MDAEKGNSIEQSELKSNDGGAWGKLLSQCSKVDLHLCSIVLFRLAYELIF